MLTGMVYVGHVMYGQSRFLCKDVILFDDVSVCLNQKSESSYSSMLVHISRFSKIISVLLAI